MVFAVHVQFFFDKVSTVPSSERVSKPSALKMCVIGNPTFLSFEPELRYHLHRTGGCLPVTQFV